MDSGTQSVEESIVRVRGEVNSNLRLWSDSTDYFNIQHDLAVRAVRRACGCVVAAVHGHGRDTGNGKSERFKILFDIGLPVSATKLKDGDALAASIRSRRKVIKFCDFIRAKGASVARMGLLPFCFRFDVKMRPDDGPYYRGQRLLRPTPRFPGER